MFNFLKIYSAHIRSSKRTILIASIGLILALTIISSTNYYFDNSKKELADSYLTNNNNNYNYNYYGYSSSDISISLYSNLPYQDEASTDIISIINNTRDAFNITFFNDTEIDSLVTGFFTPSQYYTEHADQGSKDFFTNSTSIIVQLNDELSRELSLINGNNSLTTNSRLPQTTNESIPEVYVLYFNNSYQFAKSVYYNYSTIADLRDCTGCYPDSTGNQYPVNVTGAGSVNLDSIYYNCPSNGCDGKPFGSNLQYPAIFKYRSYFSIWFDSIIFVPNLTNFTNYLLSTKTHPYSDNWVPSVFYSISINFDYTKIDPFNTGEVISTLDQFSKKLTDNIYTDQKYGFSNFSYYFNSEYKLMSLQNALTGFIFQLALVSLPVFITTIFVINYSFGLINKEIIRHIGVFKTRGATSSMLMSFQVLDNVLILIVSIIVSLVAGLPISILVLQTDFLLSFNYPAPKYYVLNFQAVSSLLFYMAVLLSFVVNTKRINRLSNMSIFETENPTDTEEPSWKKHYVDVILLGFGLVMYGIFLAITKNPNVISLLGPLIILFSLLLLPAPFALIIGLVLVINRFIPVIINKIGTFLWQKSGDLLAFSFKNVIRHKQASTRAVMLIAIVLSFMVVFYTIPYSMVRYNEVQQYYQYGADFQASFGPDGYNQTTLNTIQNNFSQYFESYSPYLFMNYENYRIMLVNASSYLNAAYLKFDLGLKHNILDDFQQLNTANLNDSSYLRIIANQDGLDARRSVIGNNITISSGFDVVRMNVVDSFVNWPVLKFNYYGQTSDILGISDISYFTETMHKSLASSNIFTANGQGVFFNFKDGVNQTQVADWIVGNTSLSITALTQINHQNYYSGIDFRLSVGQVNNDVIMILIVTIIVLIMFSYLQLTERKREIFTERALGMKLPQISLLFFIETMILSLISLIIGVFVGAFLMELIAILISNPTQPYPTFEIIFPMDLIVITNLIIVIFSVLVSIIPAYYVTKQDISKSFGEL